MRLNYKRRGTTSYESDWEVHLDGRPVGRVVRMKIGVKAAWQAVPLDHCPLCRPALCEGSPGGGWSTREDAVEACLWPEDAPPPQW